jgi:ABC-type transporter Mla MlaB component
MISRARERLTYVNLLVIQPDVAPADIPRICRGGRALLRQSPATELICDVSAVLTVDAVLLDVLARLQLTARQHGCRLRLTGVDRGLRDLLALTGLEEVLPCEELSVQPGRQTEQREHPSGVEEEEDPGDPIA